MYESFFGLSGLPFKITPDDRVFFGGAQRQEMLDALLYTIERGEGLITVIGEVGIGKTTLARALVKKFPESVHIISIFMPNVQPLDMLYMIAQSIHLDVAPHQPKFAILEQLRGYFVKQHELGKHTLLLIDEAQTMPVETLEELRLLSNMQTDDFKLLQILLFGQPELETILNSPNVRQVRDRIVYHIGIQPFSPEEVADYLEFRMKMVGYKGERFFSPEVAQAIFDVTKGFPRAVNRVADQALMSAFAQQVKEITVNHIQAPIVASTIHFIEHKAKLKNIALVVGLMLVTLLLGYVLGSYLNIHSLGKLKNDASVTGTASTETPAVKSELEVPATSELSEPSSPSLVDTKKTADNAASPVQVAPGTNTKQGEQTAVNIVKVNPPAKAPAVEKEVAAVKKVAVSKDWDKKHQDTLKKLQILAQQGKFTIQVMSDPWRLRDVFVARTRTIIEDFPEADHFIIDYVLPDGRPRIALLYGVYDDVEQAQAALTSLTASGKNYQPVVIGFKKAYLHMSASNALMME
jgi:type II secretory pathway predicted ATPase ExeA